MCVMWLLQGLWFNTCRVLSWGSAKKSCALYFNYLWVLSDMTKKMNCSGSNELVEDAGDSNGSICTSLASLFLFKDVFYIWNFLTSLRRNVIHKMSNQWESQEKPSHWKSIFYDGGVGNEGEWVGLHVDLFKSAHNFEGSLRLLMQVKSVRVMWSVGIKKIAGWFACKTGLMVEAMNVPFSCPWHLISMQLNPPLP